jgi:hypothetical protein
VFVQANSMYRNSGPVEMRPVGETEFVNGMAAICASGYCGKTKVAAGIVGYADLRLGSRVEPCLPPSSAPAVIASAAFAMARLGMPIPPS